MNKSLIYDPRLHANGQWVIYDPLLANPVTGGLFTEAKTATTNGITMQDAQGGRMLLDPTKGSPAANDEDVIYTTKKCFDWVDGAIHFAETKAIIAQAATNQLMFCFAITDTQAVAQMANGGTPKSSFSGAMIYVDKGKTVFSTCVSDGSTQTITDSNKTAASATPQQLTIIQRCINTTQRVTEFLVDGVSLVDSNGLIIKVLSTYTGNSKAGVYLGVKNGTTTAEAGCYFDYILISGNEPLV